MKVSTGLDSITDLGPNSAFLELHLRVQGVVQVRARILAGFNEQSSTKRTWVFPVQSWTSGFSQPLRIVYTHD